MWWYFSCMGCFFWPTHTFYLCSYFLLIFLFCKFWAFKCATIGECVMWKLLCELTLSRASCMQRVHIILCAIIIRLITLMCFVLFQSNVRPSGCSSCWKNKTWGFFCAFSFCMYCLPLLHAFFFFILCTVTSAISFSSCNVDLVVDSRALGQPWVWWGQIKNKWSVICSHLYMYALCADLTYNHYHKAHIYLYCKWASSREFAVLKQLPHLPRHKVLLF